MHHGITIFDSYWKFAGMFLVGAFEGKCPTLTVGGFCRRVRSTFCSIVVQQFDLWKFKTLETSEFRPKQKETNPTPEP